MSDLILAIPPPSTTLPIPSISGVHSPYHVAHNGPTSTSSDVSSSSTAVSDSWDVVLVNPEKEQVVLFNPQNESLVVQQQGSHSCPVCLRKFDSSDNREYREMASRYFALLGTQHFRQTHQTATNSSPTGASTGSSSSTTSSNGSPKTPEGEGMRPGVFNTGYFTRFFKEDRKIGSGGFGSVHLCRHVLYGIDLGTYAIKKVPVGNNQTWFNKVIREVRVLQGMHHPNIIGYRHTWLEYHKTADFGPEVPCLFILMDYANAGNLADYINLNHRKPRLLAEETIWKLFIDTLLGLNHLHRSSILHRDLKPQNLLLHVSRDAQAQTESTTLLISDFGQCEVLSGQRGMTDARTGATGTIEFMAPELHETDESEVYLYDHSVKSDVWSLGVILYSLAYSRSPFAEDTFEDIIKKLLSYQDIIFPANPPRSTEIKELIAWMMNRNPANRPTTEDLLKSPVIKQVMKQLGRTWTSLSSSGGVPQTTTAPTTTSTSPSRRSGSFRTRSASLNVPTLPPSQMETISTETTSESGTSSSNTFQMDLIRSNVIPSASKRPPPQLLRRASLPPLPAASTPSPPAVVSSVRAFREPRIVGIAGDAIRIALFAIQLYLSFSITRDTSIGFLIAFPTIVLGAFSLMNATRCWNRRDQSMLQCAICFWILLMTWWYTHSISDSDDLIALALALAAWVGSMLVIVVTTTDPRDSRSRHHEKRRVQFNSM